VALNGFQLASYWRNSVNACLQQTDLTPPPPLLVPAVSVDPFPVPLKTRTAFRVDAANPQSGASITGMAEIRQPQRTGNFITLANFKVTGSSPFLTLSDVMTTVGEIVSPFGTFHPDDQARFNKVDFDVTG
jgi:hypothetical protein